jgi:hypothetical protein
MILGIGSLVANSICPYLMQNVFTHDGKIDFRSMFFVPLATSAAAAIILALFFRPPPKAATSTAPQAQAAVAA